MSSLIRPDIPQTAIVTGGASGIGLATADRLAREDYFVAILDYNKDGADEAASQIRSRYPAARVTSGFVDVANQDSVNAAVEDLRLRFQADGGIGYLVHCAGITQDGWLVKPDRRTNRNVRMPLEQWQRVLDVNLTGTFLVLRAVGDAMISQARGGSIICLSSVSRKGNLGQANYAAAKAGVVGFVQAAALEWARYDIRVNAVAPGFTATPMTNVLSDKVLEHVKASTPMRRLATPEEMADGISKILGISFATGQVIEIDGGLGVGTGL